MKTYVRVYKCPDHPSFVSLCIEEEDGSGERVLGGKCCVNQYAARPLAEWVPSGRQWDEIERLCAEAKEDLASSVAEKLADKETT